ncbi:hypothetical protein [[Acidovorax] ebreus]|uniref:hypothetical protein n=1 Tax=Diaphorobacter sp. LI3 TaxID=2952886 RepID=UPI00204895B9|nr:hypothetical protein MRB47_13030 [Diaphorobacter sp. LI3]
MSSHHDYILEITAEHDAFKPFPPENGQPLRFALGDAVIYTNGFGAQFRCRVTGFYRPSVRIPRDGGHDSMLMADSVPA